MGFFGKIKQNLHRGGVQLHLQAPTGIHVTDSSLSATVTVTATDLPAHINSVSVEIQGTRQAMATESRAPMLETFASASSAQPFDLQPGQSQVVQLNIAIDPTAGDAAGAGIAGKLQHLAHGLAESMTMGNYNYSLVATADVEGIAMDPSTSQQLTIWKVGETGITKNFNL